MPRRGFDSSDRELRGILLPLDQQSGDWRNRLGTEQLVWKFGSSSVWPTWEGVAYCPNRRKEREKSGGNVVVPDQLMYVTWEKELGEELEEVAVVVRGQQEEEEEEEKEVIETSGLRVAN